MKKLLISILFLISSTVFASDTTGTIKILQTKYQNITEWKADFVQSTAVALIKSTVSKKGTILVKKPKKLSISYLSTPPKHYISNGKKLWIYSDGDPTVESFNQLSKLVDREALSFLEGLGNIERDFVVTSLASANELRNHFTNHSLELLALTPRSDSDFDQIILGVSPKTGFVEEMLLVNESGNQSHYTFSNIQFNLGIPDSAFEFVLPKGVKEIKH